MHKRMGSFFFLQVILLLVIPITGGASFSQYRPAWIYEVEYYTLANGIQVTLKNNSLANNVFIRLKVDYGANDEPCGMRQTAHLLEHLIFTGTTQYDEAALDQIITNYGAVWNAETSMDKTVYMIDIYSGYIQEGLSLLHHILTDSTFSDENVEKSRRRDIIHREMGGKPSAVKSFFYKRGYLKDTAQLMVEDLDPLRCNEIEYGDAITREHILKAYRTWYVPNNMHLFIVGRLDKNLRELIDELFGNLPPQNLPERTDKTWQPITKTQYRSVLSPLYDDEAIIGYWFPVQPFNTSHYYAGLILEKYLQEKFVTVHSFFQKKLKILCRRPNSYAT